MKTLMMTAVVAVGIAINVANAAPLPEAKPDDVGFSQQGLARLDDFFAREIATRRYEVLDVQRPHAERQAELPFPADGHRDPFDRMLVSQAIVEGIPLLSGDGRLHAYTAWGLVLRR